MVESLDTSKRAIRETSRTRLPYRYLSSRFFYSNGVSCSGQNETPSKCGIKTEGLFAFKTSTA